MCQKEDYLLQVTLDHPAIMMSMAGCQETDVSGYGSQMGRSGRGRDFIRLLRIACSLKFISCYFWNFHYYFRIWLTKLENKTTDRETVILNQSLLTEKINTRQFHNFS